MRRSTVPQIVLWLWVLVVTFLMGGGIFEHTVLTPLWAGSPPESVTQWQYGAVQGRFFLVVSPLCYLISLVLLILCWRMPPAQRNWSLVAALSSIIVGVATFAFFIPILQKTQATRGAGLSGEEISMLVNQFKSWNWARWIVIIGGWIAGLRALSLRPSEDSRTPPI